ncbi:MAG: tRNA (N6-isopentenyl adenosine(37)-C2)-methylthiotransferase MiaB [Spirochaetia bacterium]|nr:tRNA (N6-isopentenyl adenosine(37)-C2)-methylthiotransferase MiaB [Spirochaetia bacterium]
MKYFFETYGCQMNIAESAAVEQLLIARGWEKSETVELADMAIINTCSVRASAENRIFGRLGYFTGLKAVRNKDEFAKYKSFELATKLVENGPVPLTVVVMGCMAERLLDSLKKDWPCIDYVVGTYAKHHFGEIISAVEDKKDAIPVDDTENYKFASLSYEQGAKSTFVPIMHGCNNFCTYCIVPYVRGREISRPVEEILQELDTLSRYKVLDITLLGQNVNSYHGTYNGQDINFAQLLQIICDHLKETKSSIGWVRFLSSHPKDFSDELIDTIAKNDLICHHIALPVQHGSSEVLKAMNRRYTREHYLELVAKIKKAIPDVSLTTDIMMGFPTETEEDVELTLDLMNQVRFETACMYYYNPREGTPAAKMEQLPEEVRKARLQRVIDLQLIHTDEQMKKRIGQTVKVLVESVTRDNSEELLGKTAQDEKVSFKANKSLIGKFIYVTITELNGHTFKGCVCEAN